MWMTDQECCTSVQGDGGGPNLFLSCSLIAGSCLERRWAHTHTHTPESLAVRSIALQVLCFNSASTASE